MGGEFTLTGLGFPRWGWQSEKSLFVVMVNYGIGGVPVKWAFLTEPALSGTELSS